MSSTDASVIRMANQIARNFAVMGDVEAVKATADHIDKFWDPRMKAAGFALLGQSGHELGPVASEALQMLAKNAHPEPQTRATEFNKVNESGHSDAG